MKSEKVIGFSVQESIGVGAINPYCFETKLSIIIACFNKYAFTKACLDDLFKLNELYYEIIVIDNGSSDETQWELEGVRRCKFKYIRNEENKFHSQACNQGFKIARGKNILFLNNDIRVKSNHESWTLDLIKECELGNMVGPTMGLLDKNFNFIKEGKEQLEGNSYLSGWCIAASKETWLKLAPDGNIWDDNLFYFNDPDLALRAKEKNIPQKIISMPDIVHFGKISASQINVQGLYLDGRTKFLKKWENK